MYAVRSSSINAVYSNIARASTRAFHATRPAFVKVGDSIPDVQLQESSPGNKVSLKNEFNPPAKGLIIGVPAAFSPSCSAKHIPTYLEHAKLKDAGKVFVVSVNDAFVVKAWGESLDADSKSGIRFLADPHAEFVKALDLAYDGSSLFGNWRSKRFALEIEDGKVKKAHVEPDNTGVDASTAQKVLG